MRLRLALAACTAAFAAAYPCASCHRKQQENHSLTPHARALARAGEHKLRERFTATATRAPGFRFRLESGRVRSADSAGNTMDLPVEWAFGAGEQAVTFVTRVNDEFHIEHYWSYFPRLSRYGPTPGQAELAPKDLREAAGLLYKSTDPDTGIQGCFECHSTGPVNVNAAGMEQRVAEPGVQCEACHGPAAAHLAKPSRGNIGNPALLKAGDLNHACGRCHRPPASRGQNIDWNYAWNVRHQPIYLAESACFRKSDGKLSCLTCHDAHAPAEKRAAFYNARCNGCHAGLKNKPSNCIDCHMPRISPQEGLQFTNHWIGIYGEGSRLKPRNASAR